MTNRQWIIGSDASDPEVQVWINDSTISRRHCRLVRHGNKYFIEDLASRNGVFVDGARVVRRTAVTPGQSVRLADATEMPWPQATLAHRTIRVGRGPKNDIVLEDESVSSDHAICYLDPNNQWLLEDCGSTNGTRVNDSNNRIRTTVITKTDQVVFGHDKHAFSDLLAQSEAKHPDTASNRASTTAKKNESASHSHSADATLTSSAQVDGRKWGTFWNHQSGLAPKVAVVCGSLLCLFALWKVFVPAKEAADPQTVSTSKTNLDAPSLQSVDKTGRQSTGVVVTEPKSAASSNKVDSSVSMAVSKIDTANQNRQPTSTNPITLGASQNTSAQNTSSQNTNDNYESLIRESLYWITASRDDRHFRVGIGIAIDSHRVMTCGRVIDNLSKTESLPDKMLIPLGGTESTPIKSYSLHPDHLRQKKMEQDSIEKLKSVLQADKEAAEVQEDKNVLYHLVLAARSLARVYDLGIVQSEEPLPSYTGINAAKSEDLGTGWLSQSEKPLRPMAKHQLVGNFFDDEDAFLDQDTPTNWQQRTVQPLFLAPKVNSLMPPLYVGKLRKEQSGSYSFAGAPVLNNRGQVIGIFSCPSRLPPSEKQKLSGLLSNTDLVFDWISTTVIRQYLQSLDGSKS